jgi:hypothetical protein
MHSALIGAMGTWGCVPGTILGDKVLRNEAIRKAFLDYGYSMATIVRHAKMHY